MSVDAQLRHRKDLERRIADRALRDAAFRTALCRNPHDVLLREFGLAVPRAITLTIVEESADEIMLVLPSTHHDTLDVSREISASELDDVTGGNGTEDPEDDW